MDLKRKLARLTGVGPGGKPASRVATLPEPSDEGRAPPGNVAERSAEANTFAPASPPPTVSAAPAPAHTGQAPGPDASSRHSIAPEPSAATASPQAPARPSDPRIESLRRMLADWSERQGQTAARRGPTQPRPPPGPLPVVAQETPHGTVHVSERLLPPDHHHGSAPVAGALDVEGALVARLALHEDLAGVDYQRMLFLDTETTGLAGGTGTVPFLVGLAWFEGRSLRVHQLFLRKLGEEAPMLRVLAERMARSSCIVTFNGKSFDWPLLRTRFVLNRVKAPAELPHLDLLHCARRVFKHRGAGTRLVHMEEQVLGLRRVDDVDGSLIPDLYFRYLRGGDGASLTPVLEHNANDLLLLAALLGEMVRRFRAGDGTAVPRDEDPRDLLGFASVALRAGDHTRARAFAAAATKGSGTVGMEAHALASRLARMAGEPQAAADHLHQALQSARGFQAASLHLELTKLYEHSLKDLAAALRHARLSAAAELPEDHRRRIVRLEGRIDRSTRARALDLGARPPRPGP
ncbi:ribonuclease H-like domain-containing protein [Myxococcus sp. MISCRS1]|uniref:ribonuclease H-like domain-containing protein n=1 Tax=Myxococcus TaxID=32 RepID=UPI00226D7477|nr:ribonuclease H-like domain-containing protein [Myxococcus sp. MISCRS1]MCY1003796.1 ribonuclease H-like domain-containing protein [Myxococcus sp. MISCRS1]